MDFRRFRCSERLFERLRRLRHRRQKPGHGADGNRDDGADRNRDDGTDRNRDDGARRSRDGGANWNRNDATHRQHERSDGDRTDSAPGR